MHFVLAENFALRHAKMRDAELCATSWTWSKAALDFGNEPTVNNFVTSPRTEKFKVSSFHGLPARVSWFFSFLLTHLLSKAELCTVSASFACAPDLKRTICETKSGFVKSMPFLSWSLGGSQTARIGWANSTTRSKMLRALPVRRFFAVDSEAAATGGRPSQAVRDQRRRVWCPPTTFATAKQGLRHLFQLIQRSARRILSFKFPKRQQVAMFLDGWRRLRTRLRGTSAPMTGPSTSLLAAFWVRSQDLPQSIALASHDGDCGQEDHREIVAFDLMHMCVHVVCQHTRFVRKSNARQCPLRDMVRIDIRRVEADLLLLLRRGRGGRVGLQLLYCQILTVNVRTRPSLGRPATSSAR